MAEQGHIAGPEVSIVVPAFNEASNLGRLVDEVSAAFGGEAYAFELIVVDDHSDDETQTRLAALAEGRPWVVAVRHAERLGQSAALYSGIRTARGRYVATLDADLQNDPADLPGFFRVLADDGADLVQGSRTRRNDSIVKKVTSWVGRTTRWLLLGDTVRDTGCATRAMRAGVAAALPLHLAGMHRFIPVCARALGAEVVEVPANHRPRSAGVTKYGIRNRALVGLVDCLAVRWMLKRIRVRPLRGVGGAAVGEARGEAGPTHAA